MSDGTREIDWRTSLLPLQDLLLDRTPYTTWGGYSGLTFRAGREVHNTSYLLPDGHPTAAIIGQPHPWALFAAPSTAKPTRKSPSASSITPPIPAAPSPGTPNPAKATIS